jgi:polysaccharide biosynthesis/export protein
MKKEIFFSVLLYLVTACVPNKRYQLLQRQDVNKKHTKTDSIFRDYQLKSFDYKIQSNDILYVNFESLTSKDFDFFTRKSDGVVGNVAMVGGAQIVGEIVDNYGEIPFPVVGKVKVSGFTIFQIQEQLQILANKYLEAPMVKVRLLNYRITFIGEVNQAGTVILDNNRVTMVEALSRVGGFTDLADRNSVKLLRQNGDKVDVVYLNFLDEDFINSPYYYVHQNDIVIVPPLKQRPFRAYFSANFSLGISVASIILLLYTISR